jgi:hypothetical protein
MSTIETYVHIVGLSLTVIILSGYIIYRYLKKKK